MPYLKYVEYEPWAIIIKKHLREKCVRKMKHFLQIFGVNSMNDGIWYKISRDIRQERIIFLELRFIIFSQIYWPQEFKKQSAGN